MVIRNIKFFDDVIIVVAYITHMNVIVVINGLSQSRVVITYMKTFRDRERDLTEYLTELNLKPDLD